MSDEKQTESFSWKNKLDELNSLPEETGIDKNASWEKLYTRLQGKPRRNKAIWYWMAAACLLLVLGLSWMMTGKKENILVKANTIQFSPEGKKQQKQDATIPANFLSISDKKPADVSAVPSPEKNQTIQNINHLSSSIPAVEKNKLKKNDTAGAATYALNETIPEPANNIAERVDTTTAVATAAIVKKKLPVVHINELETSPEINADQVASSGAHSPKHFSINFIKSHPAITNTTMQPEYAGLKIPFTN